MIKNVGASVRARLLNISKSEGSDFNGVLVRYALERFLFRLSQSDYADQFLLKGALLFSLWYDMPHRTTRDIDLLGVGEEDLSVIEKIFSRIASIEVNDGIIFDPQSIVVREIRKESGYSGARLLINAELAKARCKTQIDIGFGDAVTPNPIQATFPVMISEMSAPKLKVYPMYTVIAEKFHAIALLGMTNSRMKDYLDLHTLFEREKVDTGILEQAIKATFNRRGTKLPVKMPIGLTEEFATDASRQKLWSAFLKKNRIDLIPLVGLVSALGKQFLQITSKD